MHTHKTRVWKKTVKQKMTKRWTRNLAVFPPTLGAMQVLDSQNSKLGSLPTKFPNFPYHAMDLEIQVKRQTGRSPPHTPPSFLNSPPSQFQHFAMTLNCLRLLTSSPLNPPSSGAAVASPGSATTDATWKKV
jgi:hypothetical protein